MSGARSFCWTIGVLSALTLGVGCESARPAGPVFVTPSGISHALTHRASEPEKAVPLTRPSTVGQMPDISRTEAKKTVSYANYEAFASVGLLLDSLPSDLVMDVREPPIPANRGAGRAIEEQRNVILTAALYAARRTANNEYRLILGPGEGDRDGLKKPAFVLAVLSDVPDAGDFRYRLRLAREQFTRFFGADAPGDSYDIYEPPIPVKISGSLLYNLEGGANGPTGMRSTTSWRIQPVSAVQFEPSSAKR